MSAVSNTFTLPYSGQNRRLDDVVFDPESNKFFYQGVDVTGQLSIGQKHYASNQQYDTNRANLDVTTDYERDYADRHGGAVVPDTGSTSFWSNLTDNVLSNPFGEAPALGKRITQILMWGAILGIVVLVFQSGVVKGAKA
jgi:hypothetical protein